MSFSSVKISPAFIACPNKTNGSEAMRPGARATSSHGCSVGTGRGGFQGGLEVGVRRASEVSGASSARAAGGEHAHAKNDASTKAQTFTGASEGRDMAAHSMRKRRGGNPFLTCK